MSRCNVSDRLSELTHERADQIAVAAARRGSYATITLAELDREATLLASGLIAMGVRPGHRIALLVKPSVEFVALVFALLRSGATMVLVDSGLGTKNIVRCLELTRPDGFVGIPQAHALRVVKRKQFPAARLNVTVGRRWFWGGATLESLRKLGQQVSPSPAGGGARGGGVNAVPTSPPPLTPPPLGEGDTQLPTPPSDLPHTTADDTAAIVFTSGSTGPPKGVLYRHETFVTQADEIQRQYGIRPGGVDLACFPLFGLFNVACGVTTVLPEMDFSRPASCDPKKLFRAAGDWKVTQAFASPAVWDRLSRYAQQTGEKIPTLRSVFSCGAPVHAEVIRRTLAMVHPAAELHTPYGATESLPVATLEAKEILSETAAKTDYGAGVCVGRKFQSIEWRIIRITDDPIATIDQTEELPAGEIGELIVRGPQVSREYLTQPEASAHGSKDHNALAKIQDGQTVWHRLGDVGYFDNQGRFWYCGRKSQRVVTAHGTLYTECVEAKVSRAEKIDRAALVGVGPRGDQTPVIIYESDRELVLDTDYLVRIGAFSTVAAIHMDAESSDAELRAAGEVPTESSQAGSSSAITTALRHPKKLPTDIRHNSKINREQLSDWARKELESSKARRADSE